MSNVTNALAAITDRLLHLAAEDATLRRELRSLATDLLTALEQMEERPPEYVETAAVSIGPIEEADSIPTPTVSIPAAEEPAIEPQGPLPTLRLGQPQPPAETPSISYPASWTAEAETDLSLIEKRCRLKAEGARWAATRRRLLLEAADYETEIAPKDRDIISRAKSLSDCFLWMNHPTAPMPSDLKRYEDVANAFETLADAISLVRKMQDDTEANQAAFEQALDLLAEAQSALRTAIGLIDGIIDFDQMQVFAWLKATTSEHQIFIQRYMRADDPASPDNLEDLSVRIEAVETWLDEASRVSKKRRKLLGKIRHKLSLLNAEPESADAHGKILVSTVDELIGDGMPPSNRELRELLLPVIDDLPELADLPPNFQLVLREIDRYLSSYPPAATNAVLRTTPEVAEAARLLKGRSLVLIGGDRRPGTEQALQEAFGLRELIWVETKEHQSVDSFEPSVARPDVAVVLLAIRWASHSYGEVREFCDQHGKPLVRLPGGYNPNQVAAQIMSQCSERLKKVSR